MLAIVCIHLLIAAFIISVYVHCFHSESNSSKLNICDEHATKEEPSQFTLPLTEDSSIIPLTTATASASSILSIIRNIRFPLQHYQNKHFQTILGQIVHPLFRKPISQGREVNRPSPADLMKTSDERQIKSVNDNELTQKMKTPGNINKPEDKILIKAQQVNEGETGIKQEFDMSKQGIQEKEREKDEEIAIFKTEVATLQERVHKLEKDLERSQTQVTQMAVMQEVFKPQWLISRPEITLSQNELYNGGWGRVMQATFRKEQVAAKCLHRDNIQQVVHEMNIASKYHHPNLLKYFGATLEGDPIILTELMQTNLHDVIQRRELKNHQIVPLLRDIVGAIKYLHTLSIIHGHISSSNVLLNGPIKTKWVPKLSIGSAYFLGHISEQSRAPENPTYAAPEHNHSEKMDVYSFGVLLFEICSGQAPSLQLRNEVLPTAAAVWPEPHRHFVPLIVSCTRDNKDKRPTMSDILAEW